MKKGGPAAAATPPPALVAPVPRPAASVTVSAGPTPALPSAEDLARRVAEAQKRVAEAQKNLAIKDNPYLVRTLLMHASNIKLIYLLLGWSRGKQVKERNSNA